MRPGPVACIVCASLVGACAADEETSPGPLSAEQVRPDAEQLRALDALSAPDGPGIDDDVLAAAAAEVRDHGGHGAPATATRSSSPTLAGQLDRARDAAAELAGTRLSDAGYFLGVDFSNGVGTHYIDWRLVGAPFDPARPAMLLVDAKPGERGRLAALSYWVGSDGPPDGFAGAADVWHHHLGLCFEDAVLRREWLGDPGDCAGDWIDGRDLWMLHVWLAPGYENPGGVFAPEHPDLVAG
jgi:hypothetical protein